MHTPIEPIPENEILIKSHQRIHLDYTKYLRSSHWAELRRASANRVGFKCEVCGSGENLHCHHVNYKNFYDVSLDDLMTVCSTCHDKIHKAIDNGYILQNDKWTRENTKTGMSDYLSGKPAPFPPRRNESVLLTSEFCKELNERLGMQARERLQKIFKTDLPADFLDWADKRVKDFQFHQLRRASKMANIWEAREQTRAKKSAAKEANKQKASIDEQIRALQHISRRGKYLCVREFILNQINLLESKKIS